MMTSTGPASVEVTDNSETSNSSLPNAEPKANAKEERQIENQSQSNSSMSDENNVHVKEGKWSSNYESQPKADQNKMAFSRSTPSQLQAQTSTAQNLFAGKSGGGMMCSNLRSNPFSIASDQGSSSSAILAKPKFSLKPSQFGGAKGDSSTSSHQSANSINSANATQHVAANPFLRPAKLNYDSDDADNNTAEANNKTSSATNIASESKGDDESSKINTVNTDECKNGSKPTSESESLAISTNSETFGSFGQNLATFSEASSSSFVFGEKLDDRVTNVTKENGAANGHADESVKPKIKTMEEAAVEYKKQQESGPTLPEVETVTGEEKESNVLQMNCKLFLFNEKQRSWAERGRGCLRLNDTNEGSRIVMRTIGIHKVILNTNIWPMMLCERANPRSIRITGTDGEGEGVHVFLISGAAADIEHLYSALNYRIQHLKHSQSSAAASDSSGDDSAMTSKRKTSDDQDQSPSKKAKKEEADKDSSPESAVK